MTSLLALGGIAWLAVLALIALPLVAWRIATVLAEVRDEMRELRATIEDWRQAFERAQPRGGSAPGEPKS